MSLHDFLHRDPACVQLAEGAIHCVAPLLEDPDPDPILDQLDEWAFELAGRMPLPWNLLGAMDAFNLFLFQDLKFRGDHKTYEDPANALLPRVIERRRGLPIALSILWIDLARRLGLDAVGIGLPGHFLAGLRVEVGLLCFDPFHRGMAVGEELAAELVSRATGGQTTFHPSMLTPVSNRAILSRLVRNLHLRYVRAEAWDEALWTSTHLIILSPEEAATYKERAMVHLHRGDEAQAFGDLAIAHALSPTPDAELDAWIDKLRKR